MIVGLLYCLNSTVQAASIPRTDWQVVVGRDPNRLVVKFHEESGLSAMDVDQLIFDPAVQIAPLFVQERTWLEKEYLRLRSKNVDVEDLRTYAVITGEERSLDTVAEMLVSDARIEHVYRDFLPQAPPMDIPPETPDFQSDQLDHQVAPMGFGFSQTAEWSTGEGIRIVNVEYSFDPLHEDLQNAPVTHAWGWDQDRWHFHGNAVLGQMVATDNEYGVTGAVPDAEALVISPYPEQEYYNVAAAIVASLDFLVAGDVVLIEQQTSAFDAYCPMEYVPSVFDAIQWLVTEDISVVEPSANGAHDLDADYWEGWFDLEIQDSGAIMVGGSYGLGDLNWSGGSSYGSRIDVQGWFEHIVTTSTYEYADLFYPEDSRQAYTAYFGGTSGASPQIVSVIASFNSAVLAQQGEVWGATDLRDLIRQTGRSQPLADQEAWIGSQPNASTLLRMWAW